MLILPRYPALSRMIERNGARYSRPLYLAILAALAKNWSL